jgi:hypothetical protein
MLLAHIRWDGYRLGAIFQHYSVWQGKTYGMSSLKISLSDLPCLGFKKALDDSWLPVEESCLALIFLSQLFDRSPAIDLDWILSHWNLLKGVKVHKIFPVFYPH